MKYFLILMLWFPLNIYAQGSPQEVFADDSLYQVKSRWINTAGESFNLSRYKGAPVVISMVYLSCAYSCPLTISHMQTIESSLPKSLQGKVKFVLVSFDPVRDTPEKMRDYAKKRALDPAHWEFITSNSESDIRELSALLDFKYKKDAAGEFEHSFSIIALDSDGVVKGRLDGVDIKPADLIPSLQGK